jgi:hypothetical protein
MSINISDVDPNLILNMSTYDYIGFSFIPLNDILYTYPNTIISIIGSILNIFCVIVYFKKEFNSPMFFYFRILSICFLIQNLTAIPYSLCNAPRYQSEELRKPCAYYITSYVAFGSLLAYYESVLEIAILLDRLRTFNNTIKKYLTLTPQKFSILLFVICLLVDLFYMVVFTPQEFAWYNYKEDGTLERKSVWFVVATTFATSSIGRILTVLTYFVREFVTIIFTVGFSIFLLNYMRAYFKNKAKMAKKPAVTAPVPNIASSVQPASNQQQSSSKQMSNAEEKFLQLVIVQCSLTILTRTNFFICCVMALFKYDALVQIWCGVADFNLVFTAAVPFFIYFFFNKLFKKEFLKLFNIEVK